MAVNGMIKIPKRIPLEVIRKVWGDARTEDLLTAAYGPSLLGPSEIKVSKRALENMLAFMEGRKVEGMKSGFYQAVPAVFRKYYRESPQSKGRFKTWLRRKIEEAPDDENTAVAEAATEMATDTLTRTPKQRKRRALKAARKQAEARA